MDQAAKMHGAVWEETVVATFTAQLQNHRDVSNCDVHI
jgi:hypothetical protein